MDDRIYPGEIYRVKGSWKEDPNPTNWVVLQMPNAHPDSIYIACIRNGYIAIYHDQKEFLENYEKA